VPQAVNLNTWPATFVIGRDGRVKAIHSGFAAPARLRIVECGEKSALQVEALTLRAAPESHSSRGGC
jgi:hypothetical protein